MSDSGRSTSQLLASLQARKETLEAKLSDKTQELKLLCIKEAELTGILPPEIPLEPGESPPQFRRRVGTAFTYPENLINNNNVKTKEEETLATLELEYKIQKDIADAALGMANDSSLSKAVRRKHRQVYQKIQRRLADLDAKLHHLQENMGQAVKPQQLKQRKKPRPPLENDADNQEQDPILHEEGISLSPVGPLRQPIEGDNINHRYCDVGRHVHHNANIQILPSGMWHSSSYNGLSIPISQENKPTYHRHVPVAYHHHHSHRQYSNQHYSTLPSGADLGYMVQRERLDQGCSLPGYWLRYETDLENLTSSALSRPPPMHMMYQSSLESFNRRDMKDSLPMVPDVMPSVQNKIQVEKERYGSLDRGYNRTSHSSSSPCLEVYGADDITAQMQNMPPIATNVNYYSTLPSYSGVDPGRLYQTPHNYAQNNNCNVENRPRDGVALLPSQTYPEHSLGINNQGLTRTQSLGSVETNISNAQLFSVVSGDIKSVKESQRLPPTNETLMRKQKEKEWYETSLDSTPVPVAPTPVERSCPPSRRPSGHALNEMKLSVLHVTNDSSASGKSPIHNQKHETLSIELMGNDHTSDVSSELSRSSSNISNEQHSNYHTVQAKCHEMVSPENFDTVVPFESPKNHMVVQAGKWQPYREVTKPFEMADFYKYSTKFRKNNNSSQSSQWPGHSSSHVMGNAASSVVSSHHSVSEEVHQLSAQSNSSSAPLRTCLNTNSPTPQQKGIYQPLLPMTCQPIDPDDGTVASNKSRVLGPENLEGRRGGTSKSLADAFSTEMLEWYQDQSVPRSATLV